MGAGGKKIKLFGNAAARQAYLKNLGGRAVFFRNVL